MHQTMFQLDQRKDVLDSNLLPYSSVGIIEGVFDQEKYHSVGTIIKPNQIITCASGLRCPQNNQILKDLTFYYIKDSDFKKIKVTGLSFKAPKQLEQKQETIAILKLQENIITQTKCIKTFDKNSVKAQDKVLLIGFTYFDLNNHNGFQMAQEKIRILSRKENVVQYKAYTEKSYKGAPLLLLRQQKYQLVGFHSGFNQKTHLQEGIIIEDI